MDAVGTDADGNIALTEFKSSATAGFTRNQESGFPAIGANGGTVVGNNGGAAYPAGTVIPPTTVNVSRFYERFCPFLEKCGFKLKKSEDKLIRKHLDRSDVFQVLWRDSAGGWKIQPQVGVRHERVEEVFHETSGFEKKFQAGTSTVGTSIGVLQGGINSDVEFFIESVGQIDFAVDGMLKAFFDVALQYYDQWKDVASIDEALNDEPSKPVPHLRPGLPWFRSSTGAIVAKMQRRANYEEVVGEYREVMKNNNKGFYLSRFDALLHHLKDATLP
uniref:EF-hand domain-containing protein n=1 Tax=Mycena chlorophos TaxID=658473 RepID=A0ABQ0L330_MYCCL|nr:predicted protein [Mycena chlorophos]